MCSILSKDQVARHQNMAVHQQGLRTRKAFDAARAGLARRFGACCRRGSAEGFVIPVPTKLDRLTECLAESVPLETDETDPSIMKNTMFCWSLGLKHFVCTSLSWRPGACRMSVNCTLF